MKRIILAALIAGIVLGAKGLKAEETDALAPCLDLEKIIVTPSRMEQRYKDSPVNISIIEESDIKDSGATEITQVLDTLPSVNIIDYGSFGSTKSVHTRGASSSQVITLVNGRLANTPRDGMTDHNQIPIDNIERIEVLRGPASNIYGANAVGGVINIVTKSGKKEMETEFETKVGKHATSIGHFAHGWKVNDFDYFVTSGYMESKGHRQNSDYEKHDHTVKLGYDLNNENRLTLDMGYGASEAGSPGRNSDVDLDDREERRTDYLDVTWQGSCWSDSKVLLKLYQNMDRLEFIESLSPVHSKDTHQTKTYGIDFQLSQTWFDIFRTSFGASGQENNLNSSTSSKHKYDLKAAYIETEFDPVEDLVLKAGARIDDYSNFGNKTSPSASFSYWWMEKVKVHGLMAKAFRAPTFNDLYWPREDWGIWGGVEGNDNLKPETATSKEIGVGTFLFGRVETDITYFHNKFKDMIAWTVDNSFWWRPSNVNSAVTKGVETNLNYQVNKDLKLNLNYTRLSATDTVTEKWLIYRPRHQYKGSVNYRLTDRLNWYVTGRYLSKRYSNSDNSRFLKSYSVFDTNIAYKLSDFATITFTVNNILDRDFAEEEDYPMPGTTYYIGTKFTF